MSDADEAAQAARALARARWGSQAVERAAAVVITRHAELPDAVREQVHQATEVTRDVPVR